MALTMRKVNNDLKVTLWKKTSKQILKMKITKMVLKIKNNKNGFENKK